MSKTKSAVRLSGAFQSNSPSIRMTCPRNLCISYGRVRRVETNLSNLPQPFTSCQSSSAQNAIFYRSAALLRRFWAFRDFLISRFVIFNRRVTKSHNREIRRNAVEAAKDLYSSEVVATCKTLQSRMFRLGETALNSLWPRRQSLPFNRLPYQMFQGTPQIQFLLACKLNPG